ncbi:MAG: hypothetical protein E5W28_01260 [Mesorhizobium sp.]|uniref:hypothetical protein n=1 Tax=Mesorhizobium sp. TaxID=1871066 RepID=UPI000FE949A3|nr:hypothetical protein [Mesorhizobium sp.]RWE85528.1 MAG: hypothetical protein EOS63_01345 [Mesorhizobium sp.]TIT06863.1 MAG: hypothetical protein E5W74_28180 [Mesorhizobium sp.]TIU42338.1 MAG: hypothetical protein E5W28_01260 [Mesorhizobium sp.]TIV10749.1 MAG: hypothetical protein E5V94_04660 [Mesorhizobium sp.]TJW58343.1 MAG: hypothetical protein E5V97_32905 [Mesorhizobium sp.]
MVDMSSISALAASLRMAGDITKAAIDLRDGQMIQSKVIELQGVILSAQSSALSAQADQFSLIEKVRALEKEVAYLKAWSAKAEEYEFKQVGTGAFAYMRKPDAQPPEPVAWFCVIVSRTTIEGQPFRAGDARQKTTELRFTLVRIAMQNCMSLGRPIPARKTMNDHRSSLRCPSGRSCFGNTV